MKKDKTLVKNVPQKKVGRKCVDLSNKSVDPRPLMSSEVKKSPFSGVDTPLVSFVLQ